MAECWEFLSSPKNQEVVAWLAGGLCAAISGVWAMRVKRRTERGSPSTGSTGDTPEPTYPPGVWAFAVAGLALIALSFALGGDRAGTEGGEIGTEAPDRTGHLVQPQGGAEQAS